MAAYEFEWDGANMGHIAHHKVRPEEVEQLFTHPRQTEPAKTFKGEERWLAHGYTDASRWLSVVYLKRSERLLRPITAYPMSRINRRKYAPQQPK